MDYGIHISKDDHLKKDQELRSLLIDIYSDSELSQHLQDYYNRFYTLYILTRQKDDDTTKPLIDLYRHSYSSIFQTLSALRTQDQDLLEEVPDKIKTVLEYAFREFKNSQQDEAKSRLRNALYKLHDHVSLDVLRLNQIEYLTGDFDEKTNQTKNQIKALSNDFDNRSDELNTKISAVSKNILKGETEIQNLQTRIADLTGKVEKADERTESSEHKLENVQKEYVAILSIFATVIMAISGGLAISKEMLAGVSSLNIWNLLAVFSFVGWMLLNLLFLLLHYISQILDRDKKLKYDYLVFVNLVMLVIVTAMLLYRSWDAILVPMN